VGLARRRRSSPASLPRSTPVERLGSRATGGESPLAARPGTDVGSPLLTRPENLRSPDRQAPWSPGSVLSIEECLTIMEREEVLTAVNSGIGGPLGNAALDTVLIFTHDFGRMLGFYRDTLGIRLDFATNHFASFLTPGGAGVSLHAGADPKSRADEGVVVEFQVKDIEATIQELMSRGVTCTPVRAESFGKISQFLDPEGHRIGLEQPTR
jgi:predicted enzyme related to lactoylglutathione lyase